MVKDRTAIITGSTSGIGLGIVDTLAAAGATVMLNGFGDPAQIEEIRRKLAERHGVRVAYSGADLSKPAEVRRMIEQTAAEVGAADILVNNAGIQHVAPIGEFADDKWDAILAINLSAAVVGEFQRDRLGMQQRRRGRIINVCPPTPDRSRCRRCRASPRRRRPCPVLATRPCVEGGVPVLGHRGGRNRPGAAAPEGRGSVGRGEGFSRQLGRREATAGLRGQHRPVTEVVGLAVPGPTRSATTRAAAWWASRVRARR
jgi:hypothetical protein